MSALDSVHAVVEAGLQGMRSKPSSLARALSFYSLDHGSEVTLLAFLERLGTSDPNDAVRQLFSASLQHWDFLKEPGWGVGTAPNTHERRDQIYSLLELDEQASALCEQVVPVWIATDPPIVIAEEHVPWYDPDKPDFQFYFPRYCEHLRQNGWSVTAVETLSQVTGSVVERISKPHRAEQYQSKGLVVGHVQSGKTANFTGVIARAADAGYRLFVILGGTMDILRTQTQRRIDKELIGKELLENDYLDDEEWDSFLSHGATPSQLAAFDWQRLTGPQEDYQRLKFGIDALDFPKFDPSRPLFDRINLQKSRARIMVIKKHPAVISRVARDLGRIRARLADIPTLVIDDESDLASVNTTRPTPAQTRTRTATNRAIVELLKQLPRSQYIGYTATPFANVFIDPSDAEDLFPKDFMISLPRPEGYMGIQEFHDLDTTPPGYQSNERAFVRNVVGGDAEAENLPRALDSYILSGAIKLFRAKSKPLRGFKHHTMLVHVSPRVAEQEQMATLIEGLLDSASYHSGEALLRLNQLWEEDFAPVSAARSEDSAAPKDFKQLKPHIGECLQRLEHGKRVLIVNGTPAADTPDFDRQPVWKIICGGAKLSRGYTVEGLTVSYYRRRTNAADTLMQMGRWFGFRAGYKDLVRLFIGRAEPVGQGRTLDLYAAFEAVCRDEIEFRAQLRRYANLSGDERITPKQVPPLVPAHLLRPTSTNKMYNAVVKWVNLSGEPREPTVAPTESTAMKHNERLLIDLLSKSKIHRDRLSVDPSSAFEALLAVLSPESIIGFLRAYRWLGHMRPVDHDVEFLIGQHGDPEIADWLLLAPQVSSSRSWRPQGLDFASPFRSRTGTDRFGAYSEPRHRLVARYIARLDADVPTANAAAKGLRRARRGVMLFYPVHESATSGFTMGFALQYPENSIPKTIVFSVRDPNQPNAVTVNRP
jgi:hypothetical protein